MLGLPNTARSSPPPPPPPPTTRHGGKAALAFLLPLALAFGLLLLVVAGPVQAQTTVDYDTDDDQLIEISTTAQLNAIRHDPDGNGLQALTGATTTISNTNWAVYTTAFPTPAANQCDDSDTSGVTETCAGYELMGNLDVSTDYATWTPINNATLWFRTTFEGNGHTISGVNVTSGATAGLFGYIGQFGGTTGIIRNLGVLNATVTAAAANDSAGALAGTVADNTLVHSSYATGGTITANANSTNVGGLAGAVTGGTIRASYSTNAVTISGTRNNTEAGGLLGISTGTIVASYAAGAVSGAGGTGNSWGGLLGRSNSGTVITNSYCDMTATTQTNCIGSSASGVTAASAGYTTAQLQSPTDYLGIYAHWNIDLDANTFVDFPWNFGTASQYPTLRTPTQRASSPTDLAVGDYDADDDALIDIRSQAQLAAIAHDLNGDGDTSVTAYGTTFPSRLNTASNRMGCPSGTCTGYELAGDLTLTGSWTPIGSYTATFDGQGYTISGLSVSVSSGRAGLFGELTTANGVIRNVGIISPSVTNSAASQRSGALVGNIGSGANVETSYVAGGGVTISGATSQAGGLAGVNAGRIRASYATAAVSTTGNPTNFYLGGLVGYGLGGEITASYAAGAVTPGSGTGDAGGLVGRSDGAGDTVTDSYCDSSVMLVTACIGALAGSPVSTATAAAHPTADLQSPTGYTAGSLYANWNLNLDGDANTDDDPWDFGTASQYPALKFDTDGNGTATAYEFGVQGRSAPTPPTPVDPNPQPGGGSSAVARGGGQPYHPASAHPEIYANPRHEMTASCEVVTTGAGDAAKTTSTLTFDLGTYTRPITLVLSLWEGQFFRTLQSQGIAMPELRQDGQTATVEVVTDPMQTRFRIDSEYGLNLVLGYADCHTDDP